MSSWIEISFDRSFRKLGSSSRSWIFSIAQKAPFCTEMGAFTTKVRIFLCSLIAVLTSDCSRVPTRRVPTVQIRSYRRQSRLPD